MMANVHCAAATRTFVALEHHGVDVEGWEDLITGMKPIVEKGFVRVPEKPGLGVELNEEVAKNSSKKAAPGLLPPICGTPKTPTTGNGADCWSFVSSRWQSVASNEYVAGATTHTATELKLAALTWLPSEAVHCEGNRRILG